MDYRNFIKEGTKTYAGERVIPMSSKAETIIKEALDEMKRNPEGLIFYDYVKKGFVETSQVNCFFKRICEKANVPFNGQHALRHTFATRCIESGMAGNNAGSYETYETVACGSHTEQYVTGYRCSCGATK